MATGRVFKLLTASLSVWIICGIASATPVGPPGSPNATDVKGNGSSWQCPEVNDLSGVSCTCDLPHTVRCRGQALRPDSFQSLVSSLVDVSLLDLAVHGLQRLPGSGFSRLKLMGLVVTSAGLVDVAPDAFTGLEKTLTALGLPDNHLSNVPVESLKPLRQIARLDLSDNMLQQLPSRAFPALLQLNQLTIAGNRLRQLAAEVFVRLPNLVTLDLSRNQLDAAQINDKSLRGLHALQHLNLQDNLLKGNLTQSFIGGTKGLLSLDLSHNALRTIAAGALSSCPYLRELDLSHNQIDVIEDHAFSKLTSLTTLKLSHNRVVAVSGWSLAHLSQLTELTMADNALRAVTADLVHQLPSLVALDLTTNDISLLQPDVFSFTPNLQHLALADNPLHCDCTMKWLVKWLQNNSNIPSIDTAGIVCTTPPSLENAPLVSLNLSELVCSGEPSATHEYNDYYHDYYHDDNVREDSKELRISDAEISLQVARWIRKNSRHWESEHSFALELVWRVDRRAFPYACGAVFLYEVVRSAGGETHQVLTEKVSANCSSYGSVDPHRVVVMVPGSVLVPGLTYRYCLMLVEKGTTDQESFLPGCSEPLLLSAPPGGSANGGVTQETLYITSVTAGSVNGALVVHTRVDPLAMPCTYTLTLVTGHAVAATRQLNCTEPRHEFLALPLGQYTACADKDDSAAPFTVSGVEQRLRTSSNRTMTLQTLFSACAPDVTLDENGHSDMGALWLLVFTLPGLALVVTLYLIARNMRVGGGVPWRWDPRASKGPGQYFLYTGDQVTPSLSLDPLASDLPETTTRV